MTLTSPAPFSPPRVTTRGRLLATRVALVDVLPDLDELPAERAERARGAVRAPTLGVRRGVWDAVTDAGEFSGHGFVVVSGALLRRVVAGHREGAELLGPGDLVQPTAETDGDVSWRAITDVVVAALDDQTLAEAGAVPEILTALLKTAVTRTNAVARQLVLAQWSSADERLLATFRTLSDRWGVVTPEGVALPAFLTHSVLAPIVGARRPSVTTALKRLTESGAVRRDADGRWILSHDIL
jgi:CRP-like cAMP-binding protein